MKNLLRLLLKTKHQKNRSEPDQIEKGMTLVELLVGSIMAFLIITPMLAFVVDMLNTDRKEQLKSNTEQDIQAAVDFIAQDLSQSIYIYDNAGITAINSFLPTASGTPVLVFWKRQPLKNSLPRNSTVAAKPKTCDQYMNPRQCNDTYVRSLVAYYQIKDTLSTWCQPSGGNCPTRIARYEIRDGIDRLTDTATGQPYGPTNTTDAQQTDPGFNSETDPDKSFNLNNPTVNVTNPAGFTDKSGAKNPQVLVNYIDHSPEQKQIDKAECQKALGNPSVTIGVTPTEIPEATLRVPAPDTVNSFYACVDTRRNLARVTIRGNSLRRLQTDANYNPNNSAFFPTASVQVQGLGARGN
ncbi:MULTISPECIES: hormogonium polysaccharide secretion pseudopilin HpsC [unclassified Microcoleus]|uniref:hormogonium polysaccharide secretion pseudopilin HpsC n=1 Tax=unclassified Microcoleus TaxID=2642155 RepID=UPI002FCEA33F